MLLKTAQLALLLGLTARRVNQLAEEGITVRAGHGEFDGPASVQNYVASVANRAKDGEAAIDKEREDARRIKEHADNIALKNAKLRKGLLPIDEVVRVWSEQISEVRSGMLAVVSRVQSMLSLSPEDAEVIDREIRDAMTKLADGIEKSMTPTQATLKKVMSAFRPPQKIQLSEWIEKEIRLPSTVSAVPGRVRLYPFQKGIADAIGDPTIERISVLKSARIGYSTLLNGALAHFVVNDPSLILVYLPNEDRAKSFVVSDVFRPVASKWDELNEEANRCFANRAEAWVE